MERALWNSSMFLQPPSSFVPKTKRTSLFTTIKSMNIGMDATYCCMALIPLLNYERRDLCYVDQKIASSPSTTTCKKNIHQKKVSVVMINTSKGNPKSRKDVERT
jgi:hypothetical protein